MSRYRYFGLGGNQDPAELDADGLMDELGRNLMSDELMDEFRIGVGAMPISGGDLSQILGLMQIEGVRDSQGKQ